MPAKKQQRIWGLLAVILTVLFILLQVPAAWLVNKFAPNQRLIQNVNGNVWQGQADWNLQQLQGTVNWSLRPWELIRFRLSTQLSIHSGQSELQGVVSLGLGKKLYLRQIMGQLSPETLTNLLPKWQWPSAAIRMQDVNLDYQQNQGFLAASGQWSWSGGVLAYPMGQHAERIDIPPLLANLSIEKEALHLGIRDSQKQRMADLALDKAGMLDVQITQRFLLHAPSYEGKAGLDTAVFSTRQPIMSLQGN